MLVSKDKVVTFHFTLRNGNGEIIDSSAGHDPLPYIQGSGQLIAGLEKEMEGKSVGDAFEVHLTSAEAYGERREDLKDVIPRDAFGEVEALEIGMQFYADGPEGPVVLTITDMDGDNISVDANHPLAGENLHFSIEITEIREASSEELAHGHVHGEEET